MSPRPSRLACVDALKAVSSQLIVLHHLAFYGPMSDAAQALAPGLIGWLADYARIAVQVFLVISGFLAARSLAPGGHLTVSSPMATLWRRYQKLVVPYTVAILVAIAGAAIARTWMTHDSIPAAPHLMQVVAHLLLLHNILDVDALSAGVWYIAIDLQLFALLVLTLWLARGVSRHSLPLGVPLVAALAVASLFWFNRDASWDVWAIYFFGAYGMGALAFWASNPERSPMALITLATIGAAALVVDFRLRIAVALATALLLAIARRGEWLERWPGGAMSAYFGKISYSVFLVHFPVCLVVNAVVSHLAPGQPVINALGMGLAWVASNMAGAIFHRYVEAANPLRTLRMAVWPPREDRATSKA
ncbi:Peptidoglycan/LPS O-acetylase OafA/YrhL, contains acyltransferase and SGNH-hydrolase domains [Cupriavidus sp. YR651]|uniref:acyltransferase family protein n=1 Tax=Cupriavidus sp. YR651 TaxID=1855315 RepID=UPI00088C7191|nr:acyltransferase [Cupriavidus sp. YR651]SDD71013.1 Peptidoglycan/LPS O-acetylase OafA/YrhL, contains acyltransferase and SGNH-hydrolase domains [Cupriavidus sp. YR651]